MSWSIVMATLRQRRTSLLWYATGLATYSWFIVWYFPQFAGNQELMAQIEKMFSQEMLAAFGASGMNFGSLGGFLGVEYLNIFWVLIVGFAVIILAGKVIAGDIESGTMEVTLTQPVSRFTVALSRYVALVVYAVLINLATVLPISVAGALYDVKVPADAMLLLFGVGMLVTLAIGGFAYALSAFSHSSGRVSAVCGGLLGAMWLLDFISNVNKNTEFMGKLSLFHYWKPATIIDTVTAPASTWWVFGIAAVVFPAIAIWQFMRRDVAA
ncbi:MAG: hypothetical protein CVT59_04735 [Actinobacteria bacterium HGW-Actinobacteria-1]|jgi:ABC-2 type transport system permease protein|nr:MAG: hypothetical protein CVT59_04735 [Actinobacteria bacterium HGW-Actinobacteria-1]